MSKIFRTLILLLSISLFLSCNNSKTNSKDSSNAKLTELKIGYSRLRISTPIFVAVEEKIFEKNGINPVLVSYETAQQLMQALIEGQIDLAGYTALPISYGAMERSKKKLLFLSTLMENDENPISYLIIPSKDTNTKKFTDLKNKKIGILPTIAYKVWIQEILRKNGLDPEKDVILQNIAPDQSAQALANGGIDAIFTNDPAATAIISKGIGKLFSNEVLCPKYIYNDNGDFPFGSFNVSELWANANPLLLDKVKLSLNEAIDFITKDQDKAKNDLQKYLPDQFKNQVEFYPSSKYVKTENTKPEWFYTIADLYYETKVIPGPLDLHGLIITK